MAQRVAHMRYLRRVALVLLFSFSVVFFATAQTQTDVRYFPETGHYLRGFFRDFWENNGDVPIFGYPITEEYIAPENGRITQYFERARFELTTDANGQAMVALGRLGVEATSGRTFPRVPPVENTAQRRYIPETGHIIQYGFKEIWETRGAERIFGFPISEEVDEVLENGRWHTVQYFERVRFEYWPEFAPGERVLITTLGRQLAPPELTAPLPPDSPPGAPTTPATPTPTPAPGTATPQPEPQQPTEPPIPQSVNARVTPDNGPQGTEFVLDAWGFQSGEFVGIWLTSPDQATFGADFQVEADNQGSIGYEGVSIRTDGNFQPGIWSFNAQGVDSGRQAVGYFRINRSGVASGQVGDPALLGIVAHDQLSIIGQAFILPVAAPSGIPFSLQAAGFDRNEQVSSWITAPDGTSVAIDDDAVNMVNIDDGIVEVGFTSAGLPNGIYSAVIQGRISNVVGAAAFKITNDYVAGPGTTRPGNVNGSVTPAEGGAGTLFQVRGQNLQPGEAVELWVTDPAGVYVLFPGSGTADAQGQIGYDPPINIEASNDLLPGVYGIHFRGRSSGARVSTYFTFTGSGGQSLDTPVSAALVERITAQSGGTFKQAR